MRLRSRWPVPAPMLCCWRVAGGTLTRSPISQGLGRRAVPAVMDLADADAITTTFAQVVADTGRLDVLVNVAATDVPGPVTDLGVRDWDHVLGVNLRAPFLLAKLAFPRMQAAGGGTIIKVSSVAGKRGWANASTYCASNLGSPVSPRRWPRKVRHMGTGLRAQPGCDGHAMGHLRPYRAGCT
jgi:short chain dehydrogenase